ncbi:hypothetical protein DEU56DRAFT_754795 [Suillus clintonianus]|uniref:uncharacterized protein n=1 Tax=Suillus clintonianus TaxID=1904413 RepID=UPI001B88007E|nr:uncharacterized protein DEU56DRAFT_754795 [Suillus clintonianus]KAG2142478.1 hypothetical protein DEU56DRAFT_754795 [Suillus clintonianus]
MVMATVKVARVSFGSQLKKSCLLSPQRSFSALKSASTNSTTRTAPPPSTSRASSTASSSAPRKSATKNEKKAKKALPASDGTEAQLKQIESMMNMANTSNLFPTMDMWGTKSITQAQSITNSDVEIPSDAPLRMLFSNPGAFWHAKQHNFSNWLKNTFSMYTIAKAEAFTGVDCDFRSSHLFLPRTWRQLGNITSHSSKSWLAPMRRIAMDNYLAMGHAIADKDEATLKVLTTADHATKVNKIIRTRKPSQFWQWKVLSDVSDKALFQEKSLFRPLPILPGATVVSIRSGEVYVAKEPPKRGNRLVIHALVKFETEQELKVFTKQGQLVDAKSAEPHRVVEYLVLEKVGWYDNTWQVRDQIYK